MFALKNRLRILENRRTPGDGAFSVAAVIDRRYRNPLGGVSLCSYAIGTMAEGSRFVRSLKRPWQWVGFGLILGIFGFPIVAQMFWPDDLRGLHESRVLQNARAINLFMFSYANDHDGKYPSGASSTEVFQKLIDEKYAVDPTVFYYEMRGKTKPTSDKLRPKNVSYDITVPLDDSDSDYLPVVFLTGYRIQYIPGGSAVPLTDFARKIGGHALAYKDNSAFFIKSDVASDGVIHDVISKDFNPAGKKYQQLTPDGPLPP